MPEPDTSKSKADVEAELRGSSDAIQDRLDAIRGEIMSTGDSLRQVLRDHPLASVGGSLLAGALIGWLVAGVGKQRLSRAHRALLDQYIEALRDEVRAAVADGEEVGAAVQEALRNRAPLVVYANDDGSGSWLGQVAEMIFSTASTLFLREMVSGMMHGLGGGGDEQSAAPDGPAQEAPDLGEVPDGLESAAP